MRQTVVVTGAASGLGAALARHLEDNGKWVVGVDVARADVVADLATAEGRAHAVERVLEITDGAVDGLVPCAGLGPQHPSERIVAVNYFGAVAMVQGLYGALRGSAHAATVMICSNSTVLTPGANGPLADACVAGEEHHALELASSMPPAVAYAASKVAVGRFVRHKAAHFGAEGVRINAVAPGAFDTPLLQEGLDDPETGHLIEALPIALGRRGTPDEIASVVVFLLSDGARYVQGANLFVDGGTDAMLFPDRFP